MSDSGNVPSGYGSAMDGLMTELSRLGHECYYLGWQYCGEPDRLQKHSSYICLQNMGGHPFGAEALGHHLMTVQPDVLVALGDFYMVGYVVNYPRVVPFCHWFPIDGTPVTDEIKGLLRYTDMKVCFSKFGLEECRKAKVENVKYIPHGVNSEVYHPLSEEQRKQTRQVFAATYGIPDIDKKFIVGQVNRNQRRKMFDRWIQAVALAHQKDHDVIGWLHADYREPRDSNGWNIPFLLKRLGLDGQVFQTPGYVNYMVGLSPERLNEVYNAFDVHFSATGGEGFGLTTVESQAAGVPNIITDYTTSRELVEGHGCLIKPETYEICGAGVDRALIDVNAAADAILELKNNPELRREYAVKGREHMVRDYNWGKIGVEFSEFLVRNLEVK